MDLYINSVGIISGAGNNMSEGFLQEAPVYDAVTIPVAEPDYKQFIPVMQLRRMSKAVRMGVVAAKTAMQQSGLEAIDAISVGTAYGCLQDTEAFLGKMIEQEEQMLTPTAFIQSTHNTVSGQIALLMGCNGHNLTYVQRGHSFEHALINTQLYLNDHQDHNMLVGGIDELTPAAIKALQEGGLYTTTSLNNDAVNSGNNTAAVGGEGAAFFTVSSKPTSSNYVRVTALNIFKADPARAFEKVKAFVAEHGAGDVLLSGANGTQGSSEWYGKLKQELFTNMPEVRFKNLCGEYPVAASFAIGMLLQGIPSYANSGTQPGNVKDVILINNHCDYYSCWKLQLA